MTPGSCTARSHARKLLNMFVRSVEGDELDVMWRPVARRMCLVVLERVPRYSFGFFVAVI